MKIAHRWKKVIIYIAILILPSIAGTASAGFLSAPAADYKPTDNTVGNMSVNEARKMLTSEMKGDGKFIYYDGKSHKITNLHVNSNKLIVIDESGKQSIILFENIPKIVTGVTMWAGEGYILLADQVEYRADREIPTSIANALYVLKQHAIKDKKDADEFDANFAASLADYRNKFASNSALPEEANKYKVQAEDAVRDKQFDDAADLYAEALKIAPWWPVGHFNRAQVLGEIGNFGEAMHEMKYYLQLVPLASNARAAQDKIYSWERMESK